jgi:hypothetical protein
LINQEQDQSMQVRLLKISANQQSEKSPSLTRLAILNVFEQLKNQVVPTLQSNGD